MQHQDVKFHKVSIYVILYARFSKAAMKTTLGDGKFLSLNPFVVLAICLFHGA